MTLTPYVVETLGGLRIDADPFEVGSGNAVYTTNLDTDVSGQLRTRPGRAYFDSDDSATFSDDIIRVVANPQSSAETRLLATSATKLAVYTGGSVYTATVTADASGRVDVMPASVSTDWVQDATGLRQWDNGAHTLGAATAGTPQGGHLAYAPRSSRIVIAGANASGATASRVNFLDPGLSTFTSTNWVDVEPGFESIIGAATLGDLVFVFKHTRAYIFYGESTDSTGKPVFNYRALNLGDRIRPYDGSGNIKPGRVSSDGNYLYYAASRGVYRTNGGPPELISGPVTPAFRNEVAALGGFDNGETYVLATQDRLYVGSRLAATVLVLEKANGQWVIYAFPSVAMAPSTDLRSAYTVNARRLVTLTPTVTTDLGLGLDWFWQSGKYPLAGPGQVAVAPLHSLVGTGTVTMALNSDLYSTQTATVTLGTAPTPAEGWASPLDQEGRWMQTSLSGTGPATISEIKHFVSLVKPAGIG